MKPTEKIKELAKKLKALADRGVGGEKINALQKFNELVAKYNIMDLEFDEIKPHVLKTEKELFNLVAHIAWTVRTSIQVFGSKRDENTLIIDVTELEFIEISALVDMYTTSYKQELAIFMKAFIFKNDLSYKGDTEEQNHKTDKIDYREYKKMQNMMDGIDRHERNKQLGNGR